MNIIHPSQGLRAVSFMFKVRSRGGERLFSLSKYLVRYSSWLMAASVNAIILGFSQVVLKVL